MFASNGKPLLKVKENSRGTEKRVWAKKKSSVIENSHSSREAEETTKRSPSGKLYLQMNDYSDRYVTRKPRFISQDMHVAFNSSSII